ncbi:MAG: methyltransferase family protein, partial [Spirochaetota bacterium]
DEINFSIFSVPEFIKWIAVIILVTGVLIISVSYIQLGTNLRLGLPQDGEYTSLQKNGIYKISRNPIYIGFFLMLLASSLYVINPFNWVCAVTGVIIHHKQILAEEVFLKQRFGKEWTDYKNKVNRYL